MLRPIVFALALTALLVQPASSQQTATQAVPWGPLDGAEHLLYREVGGVKLYLNIFRPSDWKPADKRPAIVFFYGGGWTNGNPAQFHNQCKYLAARGMVTVAAEYRVKNRHGTTPFDSLADAKSAIGWVRQHAGELGIDHERIAAGGGSAGGHLAAATAVIGNSDGAEPMAGNSIPNALVLFNPVLDTTRNGSARAWQRLGDRAEELSVFHHLGKQLPPTIIFHGTKDQAVPIESIRRFRDAAVKLGNRCELVEFEGRGHSFFNFKNERDYLSTLRRADLFLVSLGYLHGKPTIEEKADSAAEPRPTK